MEQVTTESVREPGSPSSTRTDLGFLWDFWYPAIRSDEVYGRKLAKAMLLEIPLVIGRTSRGKSIRNERCVSASGHSPLLRTL